MFSGLSIRLHMAFSDVFWSQWTLFKAQVLAVIYSCSGAPTGAVLKFRSSSICVPDSTPPQASSLRYSGQSLNSAGPDMLHCENADGLTTTWSIEKSAVARGVRNKESITAFSSNT